MLAMPGPATFLIRPDAHAEARCGLASAGRREHRIVCSMSRSGDVLDNAAMKSPSPLRSRPTYSGQPTGQERSHALTCPSNRQQLNEQSNAYSLFCNATGTF
jgi:hypothetical protein